MARRIFQVACAVLSFAGLSVGQTASADTIAVLDQRLETITYGAGFLAATVYTPAQSFTPQLSGRLERVELPLVWYGSPTSGSVTVSIVDLSTGSPWTGTTLASEVIDASTIPLTWSTDWFEVAFDPAAQVVSGSQYAIVVASTTTSWLLWQGPSAYSTSYYPGGVSSSLDYGVVVSYGGDLSFRTYVAAAELDADRDGSPDDVDCADDAATIHPGAVEVAGDGIDQNCNGHDLLTYYTDSDGDTYGWSASATELDTEQPTGSATRGGDADDSDEAVYPDAPELCDGKDNDQDEAVDEGFGDADGDLSADCVDPDDDGDGVTDNQDPDGAVAVVETLPSTSISGGNKNAVLSRLEYIESLIQAGRTGDAISELRSLRRRVDGCSSTSNARPDKDDWVVNCVDQRKVRAEVDGLIAALS